MNGRNALTAYLSTIGAIVLLAVCGAVAVFAVDDEKRLAQIIAALGFIGSAITALAALAGGFRPRQQATKEGDGS